MHAVMMQFYINRSVILIIDYFDNRVIE